MHNNRAKEEWESYARHDIQAVTPILERHGFALALNQPHIGGERYVMRAVTTASGKKLVLEGCRMSDNTRGIIKVSRDSAGIREIEQERKNKKTLEKLGFAYEVFFAPEEMRYFRSDEYTIVAYEYIAQEKPFIERSFNEQFSYALRGLQAQESAHATTHAHRKRIRSAFESFDSGAYIRNFETFKRRIGKYAQTSERLNTLNAATDLIEGGVEIIDQYGEFLTHTDFVPHNFRIRGGNIYLLDHSSLRFGNKYEGWARFINFMALYNPALEETLVAYVQDNRTPEESESLKIMRVYRLGEITGYYATTLALADARLHTLNNARVSFWFDVLTAVMAGGRISKESIGAYITLRDALRSDEEKLRQRGLH